jgi:hypothetical protein
LDFFPQKRARDIQENTALTRYEKTPSVDAVSIWQCEHLLTLMNVKSGVGSVCLLNT